MGDLDCQSIRGAQTRWAESDDEKDVTLFIFCAIISVTDLARLSGGCIHSGGEMSKKMLSNLVGVLLLVVLFASLVGCGAKKSSTAGSTITILIAEDPPSFNAMISDTGYDSLVMELVMLGMTDIDPQGNVLPELAAELPTVENGGVVVDENAGTMDVTWKMRQDIQWADGKPVTADDVVFTWTAIKNPETGSWIPGIDYIDSLDKVDDYTFVIKYNTIYPGYLTQLGGEQLAIWPAHYCNAEQGFAAWDCGRQPLSDGPYVLKEWVTGDHLSFTRNPKYYQPGKPSIENVIVRIVPDATVRKTMMINGDADINMWVTEQVIADLENSGTVAVSISPTNRWVVRLFMNEAAKGTVDPVATPHPILSDVRVRQAIRLAIDVDTISQQIFYGYGVPVWTEFFRPPYICDIPRPKFDLEAAKALLEQAGWTDNNGDGVRECHGCMNAPEGYLMEMEFITYAEYGEPLTLTQQFIAEALGKIGMKLNLSVIQGSVLWADSQSGGIEQTGNFDIDLWDDGYGGIDPTDYLWELYSSAAATPDFGWNIARWQNEEFNDLLNSAYTLDESYRKETFCWMAQILDEQLPDILMFSSVNADAYSLRLQGVQSSTNDLVTWNIADWQIVK
jgi:peptide/nickel transport system substrate-binding protein